MAQKAKKAMPTVLSILCALLRGPATVEDLAMMIDDPTKLRVYHSLQLLSRAGLAKPCGIEERTGKGVRAWKWTATIQERDSTCV